MRTYSISIIAEPAEPAEPARTASPQDVLVFPAEHVVTRRLDEELVLLNLDTECYFGLDEVGTRMWEVLTSTPSLAAARRALLDEFDVDAERLGRDLDRLVSQLSDHGLVELRAP